MHNHTTNTLTKEAHVSEGTTLQSDFVDDSVGARDLVESSLVTTAGDSPTVFTTWPRVDGASPLKCEGRGHEASVKSGETGQKIGAGRTHEADDKGHRVAGKFEFVL